MSIFEDGILRNNPFLDKEMYGVNVEKTKNYLKKFNGIYSKELLEYLESLLMLETNIVNDNTYNGEKLELLRKIEIFKRISNYNVYECAKKTLENTGIKTKYEYDERYPILSVAHNGKLVFDSCFPHKDVKIEKASFIIHQLILDEDIRKQKIEELYKKYNEASKQKNPYTCNNCEEKNKHVKSDIWQTAHREKLSVLKEYIEILKSRKQLEEQEKNREYLSKQIYEAFQEEYGPFEEEPKEIKLNGIEIKEKKLVKDTPFAKIHRVRTYY